MGARRRGVLLAVSAPLGFGKATLCQALLDRQPDARLSVSCTSRALLPREVDGIDFNFLAPDEFQRRLGAGEFLEAVSIDGHWYGTPETPVESDLAVGRDVILNLDTQGARAVKKRRPDAVLVFVSPSTWDSLKARFGKDAGENLARRLRQAREDLEAAQAFDYVVLAPDVLDAADDLATILEAERLRGSRVQPDLVRLLQSAPA